MYTSLTAIYCMVFHYYLYTSICSSICMCSQSLGRGNKEWMNGVRFVLYIIIDSLKNLSKYHFNALSEITFCFHEIVATS